jgi:hypothetical protein
MNFDTAGSVPPDRDADHWNLPDVLTTEVHHVHYKTPRRYTLQGKDYEASEAVEITIETSEPFPIRALNPTLFVGDVALTPIEAESDLRYRFVALQPDALKPAAPITIAWNSSGAPRKATGLIYQPPTQRDEER